MNAHNNGHDVPHGTIGTRIDESVEADHWLLFLGHFAVWAVCYSVGISLILGEFLEKSLSIEGLAYVALCSHSGYLLDRVKFRDRDLDPADLMADPARHLFLRRHARWLRLVMVTEWILAVGIGLSISPVLGVLVMVGIGAGYVYSGWKPGGIARLKDVAGLKAVMVSGAIVGLGVFAVLAGSMGDWRLEGLLGTGLLVWTIVGIGLIVLGDAVICDLDDQVSDGAHLTKSLPVMMGMRRAGLAGGVALALGGLLVVIGGLGTPDLASRWLFVLMVAVSGIGIMRQNQRRDWIDARMLAVVLVVMFVQNVASFVSD